MTGQPAPLLGLQLHMSVEHQRMLAAQRVVGHLDALRWEWVAAHAVEHPTLDGRCVHCRHLALFGYVLRGGDL